MGADLLDLLGEIGASLSSAKSGVAGVAGAATLAGNTAPHLTPHGRPGRKTLTYQRATPATPCHTQTSESGDWRHTSSGVATRVAGVLQAGRGEPTAPADWLATSKAAAVIADYNGDLSQREALAWAEVRPGGFLPAGDGLALWRAGFALLSPDHAPCPGYERGDSQIGFAHRKPDPCQDYGLGDWPRAYDRAADFLDRFGEQAEELGWTTPELFGVHPRVGIIRADHCGGLVLTTGGRAVELTATEVRFGHLIYRRNPHRPRGVPIWSFGQ